MADSEISTASNSQNADNPSSKICCLVDDRRRCHRRASGCTYSAMLQRFVAQKQLKLALDRSAGHVFICDRHKAIIQSSRPTSLKRAANNKDYTTGSPVTMSRGTGQTIQVGNVWAPRRKRSKKSPPPAVSPVKLRPGGSIDFSSVGSAILRRYRKAFRLGMNPKRGSLDSNGVRAPNYLPMNDDELAKMVERHFDEQQVGEHETLTYFLYIVRYSLNRIDRREVLQF